MKPRTKITNRLLEMGFENITLYFWAKDGWYLHCDDFKHVWIGQNYKHVLHQLTIEFPTRKDVMVRLAGFRNWELPKEFQE